MKIKIAHGQVIGDSGVMPAQPTDVYIADAQIIALGAKPDGFAEDVCIDATNQIVCPGFIDLYSALRPDYSEELAVAVTHGFNAVTIQPDIVPRINQPAIVDWITHHLQTTANLTLMPIAALCRDAEETSLAALGLLKAHGCVGAAAAHIKSTHVLRLCLEYAANYEFPVFVTPQDPWFSEQGSVHEGERSVQSGLPGIPTCAETIEIYRYLELGRLTGAKIHFNKISSKEGVELIRSAKAQGVKVSAGVSVHHLWFTDNNVLGFSNMLQCTPPLRAESDRQALLAGLRDGTIDVVVSDYSSGTQGSQNTGSFSQASIRRISYPIFLPFMLRLRELGWSLPEIVEKCTKNPALLLGQPSYSTGSLAVGAPANLCIFDPHAVWRFSDSTLAETGIDVGSMWDGEFCGQVRHTLYQGQIVSSHKKALARDDSLRK